jgi:cyclophilin family peptidyl-prolyl cis-trans isomerase
MIRKDFPALVFLLIVSACNPKLPSGLRKNDLKKNVEMTTDHGTMIIQLSDSTPLHRDNFLKLVKSKFYDSLLFHRVIKDFMIQGGDPDSKRAKAEDGNLGGGGVGYTIPAEFKSTLFHKRGAIAAARNDNPEKASSGCQFYVVQGRKFTDSSFAEIETTRLQYKIPEYQRKVYTTVGGTPWLDQGYTVFGEVIRGIEVVDSIAAEQTNANNRPIKDIRIIKVRLVKRER